MGHGYTSSGPIISYETETVFRASDSISDSLELSEVRYSDEQDIEDFLVEEKSGF